MTHIFFIIGAYGFATLAMGWCALAPVLRGRRLKRILQARDAHLDDTNAPRP